MSGPRAEVRVSRELLPVVTGACDLRREPDHRAELLTQIPHGHLVLATETKADGRWRAVLGSDGLRGWAPAWSLGARRDAARCLDARGAMVATPWAAVRMAPGASRPLSLGSRVVPIGRAGLRVKVRLARGEIGTIEAHALMPEPAHGASLFVAAEGFLEPGAGAEIDWPWAFRATRARVAIDAARSLLGVPYLWGGTTAGGFDCSGLMRSVFLLAGVPLPRDARDQAAALSAFAVARGPYAAGDLLFFGTRRKVTHVGLVESPRAMLHASGEVRRSRFLDAADRALFATRFLAVRPPYGGEKGRGSR